MKVNKIDHICVAVKNLDQAKKVWEPMLGKAEPDDAYVDEPDTYPWPEQGMYQRDGDGERLFTPCTLCNGKGAPAGYSPIADAQVPAWADQFRPDEGRSS